MYEPFPFTLCISASQNPTEMQKGLKERAQTYSVTYEYYWQKIITRGPRAWRSADRKQTGKKPDFKICLICVFNSIS
jgi:hypothetical protein